VGYAVLAAHMQVSARGLPSNMFAARNLLACSRHKWNASKAQPLQQRVQPVSQLVKVGNGMVPFITIFMPPWVELHSTIATSERRLP